MVELKLYKLSEHWTDAHITQHPITKEYTGWDETGTWVVHQSMNNSEVVEALTVYSDNIDRRGNASERGYENDSGSIKRTVKKNR
jgi:hypothetical protein